MTAEGQIGRDHNRCAKRWESEQSTLGTNTGYHMSQSYESTFHPQLRVHTREDTGTPRIRRGVSSDARWPGPTDRLVTGHKQYITTMHDGQDGSAHHGGISFRHTADMHIIPLPDSHRSAESPGNQSWTDYCKIRTLTGAQGYLPPPPRVLKSISAPWSLHDKG